MCQPLVHVCKLRVHDYVPNPRDERQVATLYVQIAPHEYPHE